MNESPRFSENGFLPPYLGKIEEQAGYSPHLLTSSEVVHLLGYTPTRRKMLRQFFMFRKKLHKCGVQRGVQWLGGSFVEKTEVTRSREPQDIDVVTLFGEHMPMIYNRIISEIPAFTDPAAMKENFALDSYFVKLPTTQSQNLDEITFWSSLFGHSKQNVWKGYICLDLDRRLAQDDNALILLNEAQ